MIINGTKKIDMTMNVNTKSVGALRYMNVENHEIENEDPKV